MKKLISAALVLTLVLSLFSPAIAAETLPLSEEEEYRVSDEFAAQFPKGAFNLSSISIETHEYSGRVTVDILRMGGAAGSATVTLKAIDLSAKNGTDYRLNMPAALFSKTIESDSSDETLLESDGTTTDTYSVESSSALYEVSPSPAADETPVTGLRSIKEQATGITSDRNKFSPPDEQESQTLALASDAAADYYDQAPGTSFTLSFGDGERVKHFYLDVIDDAVSEAEEQIVLVITGVSDEGAVGLQKETTVNIIDNEPYEQPAIGFSAHSYSADTESATITLIRTAGINYYAGGQIYTVDDNAVKDIDYTPLNQDFLFVPGQTQLQLSIPVEKNQSAADKSFYVRLVPNTSCTVTGDETVEVVIQGTDSAALSFDASDSSASLLADEEEVTLGVKQKIIGHTENDLFFYGDSNAGHWVNGGGFYDVLIEHDNMKAGVTLYESFYPSMVDSIYADIMLYKLKKDNHFDVWIDEYINGYVMRQFSSGGYFGSSKSTVTLPVTTYTYSKNLVYGRNGYDNHVNAKVYEPGLYGVTGDPFKVSFEVRNGKKDYAAMRLYSFTVNYRHYKFEMVDFHDTRYTFDFSKTTDEYIAETVKPGEIVITTDDENKKKVNGFYGSENSYTFNIETKNVLPGYYLKELRFYDSVDAAKATYCTYDMTFRSKLKIDAAWLYENAKYSVSGDAGSRTLLVQPIFAREDVTLTVKMPETDYGKGQIAGVTFDSTLPKYTKVYTKNNTGAKPLRSGDKVILTGVGEGENAVTGYYVTLGSGSDSGHTTEAVGLSSAGILTLTLTENTTVTPIFGKRQLDVKLDPDADEDLLGTLKMGVGTNTVEFTEDGILENIQSGQLIDIVCIPPEGYTMQWANRTGDLNGNGVLDDNEVRDENGVIYRQYDYDGDGILDTEYSDPLYGDLFSYKVDQPRPLYYYNFVPLRGQLFYNGEVSGHVVTREFDIRHGYTQVNNNNGDMVDKLVPVSGATVKMGGSYDPANPDTQIGYSSSTGSDGRFSFQVSKVLKNAYYILSIDQNGSSFFIDKINPSVSGKNYILPTFSSMKPISINAYPKNTKDKTIVQGSVVMIKEQEEVNFTLLTAALENNIRVAQADFRVYSEDGNLKSSKLVPVSANKAEFKTTLDKTFEQNDRLAVLLIDQNGGKSIEYNTGFQFRPPLPNATLLPTFAAPLQKSIPIFDTVMGALDLGLASFTNAVVTEQDVTVTFGYEHAFDDKEKVLKDTITKAEENNAEGKKARDKVLEENGGKDAKIAKSDSGVKTKSTLTNSLKVNVSLEMNIKYDTKRGKGEGSPYYFNSLLLMVTLTDRLCIETKVVLPVGLSIITQLTVGGSVTGFIKITPITKIGQLEPIKVYADQYSNFPYYDSDAFKSENYKFHTEGGVILQPMLSLKITGEYGVASVSVEGKAEFFLVFTTDHNDHGTVTLNAGIGVSVLGFEVYSKEFVDYHADLFGSAKSFLLGLQDDEVSEQGSFAPVSRDYLKHRGEWLGSDPFLALSGTSAGAYSERPLLSGIYPYPDIQLMRIDSDSLLMVFVDDDTDRTSANRGALYYAVSHDNGVTYSASAMFADDGLLDSHPRLVDLGDKILCLYSSLDRHIADDLSMEEVLEANGLEMMFFDKSAGTFVGSPIDVTAYTAQADPSIPGALIGDYTSDEHGVAVNDATSGNMLILYTKSDYTSQDSDRTFSAEDLFDTNSTYSTSYSTIAYRVYNTKTDAFLTYTDLGYPGNAETPQQRAAWDTYWYGQKFLDTEIIDSSLPGGKLSDPLVYDMTAAMKGRVAYIAYTVDMDSNFSTADDRDIYLITYDFETNAFLKATKASDIYADLPTRADGKPQLVLYEGRMYLFYTSDTAVCYILADNVIALAQGKALPEGESLPSQPYTALADTDQNHPADDYVVLAGDDGKLYLIWTEETLRLADGIAMGTQDAMDAANWYHEDQVYASVFHEDTNANFSEIDFDNDPDIDLPVTDPRILEPDIHFGQWSEKVQITEGPGSYDDICASVMSNGKILMAAKKSRLIPIADHEDSPLRNDPNTAELISMTLTPAVQAEFLEEAISFYPEYPLAGESVTISAAFSNQGLLPLARPTVDVYAVRNSVETYIASAVGTDAIYGGGEGLLSVEWTVPADLQDLQIIAKLRSGASVNVLDSAQAAFPHNADLEYNLFQLDHIAQNYYRAYIEVLHTGNKPLSGAELVISRMDAENVSHEIKRVALAEEITTESLFIINEAFELPNDCLDPMYGVIGGSADIRVSVEKDGVMVAGQTATLIKDISDLYGDRINAVDNVVLSIPRSFMVVGDRYTMRSNLYPTTTADDFNIVYRSSDPGVVSVQADGSIDAIEVGTATITAYAVPNIAVTALTIDGHSIKGDLMDNLALEDCKSGSVTLNVLSEMPDFGNGGTEPSSADDPNTAATAVNAVSDAAGKATAVATDSQIGVAIQDLLSKSGQSGTGMTTLRINVDTPAEAGSVETRIPSVSLQRMTDTQIGNLTVSSPIADVSFDHKTLLGILAQTAETVAVTSAIVSPAALPEAARELVGERPVYDFSVSSGGRAISQFDGTVTVSVPYAITAGEDPNAIVIYYMNDSGELEIVSNCSYNAKTGKVTFTTNHFSTYAVGYNKITFSDVTDSAWYAQAITFAAARGIINGAGSGRFLPDSALTRGQFVTMLLRAYGIAPDADLSDNFADAGNTYYTGYLAAAKRLGIAGGVGSNRFEPDRAITRQEMAVLLRNALTALQQMPEESTGTQLSEFNDSSKIAPWAAEAFAELVDGGILNGSGGALYPTDVMPRKQAAQVLYNLLSK